jgi:hypothetical protein
MTKREAIVLTAYTGILLCNLEDYYEYVEKLLGRPVFTHELADKKTVDEIKEGSKEEAEAILSNLE